MKKAIVFLLAVAISTTLAAQSGRYGQPYPRKNDNAGVRHKNDRSWENNRRDNSYDFTVMERDRAIRAINYKYDRQIDDVKRQRFVRAAVKNRQIRMIDKQRVSEIREIHKRFQHSNNRYYKNDRRW
jgi:hypothetical protein